MTVLVLAEVQIPLFEENVNAAGRWPFPGSLLLYGLLPCN